MYSSSACISMAWVAREEYNDENSEYSQQQKSGLEGYFTFTLSYDGGNEQTVRYGDKLTEPETPDVSDVNSYFVGWTNKSGTSVWNFETDNGDGEYGAVSEIR